MSPFDQCVTPLVVAAILTGMNGGRVIVIPDRFGTHYHCHTFSHNYTTSFFFDGSTFHYMIYCNHAAVGAYTVKVQIFGKLVKVAN